jgi:protein tyrosine/serine phosphatase
VGEVRWVRLEGAANVRDLGGLPTEDGRCTAYRRLLRSDNLQGLTDADRRLLVDDLGLRTVVDLRTEVELVREGPGPLTREPLVVHRHHSLLPAAGKLTDVAADALLPWQEGDGASSSAGPVVNYLRYLRDRPDSVLAALRSVARPDRGGAAVVHCAAGKDRTGVVIALALSAVGVCRDAVVADYVATGEVIEAIVGRLLRRPTYAEDVSRRPVRDHRPRAATMEGFLAALDGRFGGPVGWLAAAGFGAAEVAALRARLLD